MVDKLALGTVQFGLDYGISNRDGRVSQHGVSQIIQSCRRFGIDTLDTATAYGYSEEALGQSGVRGLKVVTKIPAGCSGKEAAKKALEQSLARMDQPRLYGWLYHSYEDLESGRLRWRDVAALQEDYGIEKIGFSLTNPDQWKDIVQRMIIPGIIQVPYNLFDRRFEAVYDQACSLGVEVHVRSAFLQGLLFMDPSELSPHFASIRGKLTELRRIVSDHNLNIAAALLRFVVDNTRINKVVFGVVSVEQLEQNILSISAEKNDLRRYSDCDEFVTADSSIVNPANWP